MKRSDDHRLIDEIVLVDPGNQTSGMRPKPGKVLTVMPEDNVVLIEFPDGSQAEYKLEKLLHLYPKAVIMQGLISNADMGSENFKTVLQVTRLIAEKRNAEALVLAVSNEHVKFFCLTDCKSWLEMQRSVQKQKRIRQHAKKRR